MGMNSIMKIDKIDPYLLRRLDICNMLKFRVTEDPNILSNKIQCYITRGNISQVG